MPALLGCSERIVNMKMKSVDLKFFKEKLIKMRSELTDEVTRIKNETLKKSNRDSSGDLSGYSLHMADQATDNFDREFSLDLAHNEQEILYNIDTALKRIDEKSYGQCITCNKTITKQRLKAVPYADYCIVCQEAEEKDSTKKR